MGLALSERPERMVRMLSGIGFSRRKKESRFPDHTKLCTIMKHMSLLSTTLSSSSPPLASLEDLHSSSLPPLSPDTQQTARGAR